jgi:hypothetical protein
MILTKNDNIIYLLLIAILFISIIIKILCIYVFKCEEKYIKNNYYKV